MTQFAIILVTALMTILGVVVAKMLEKLLIDPLQEFQRVRGRIANVLTRHWGVGGAFATEDGKLIRPDHEEIRKVSDEINGLSSDLRGSVAVIPFYRFWVRWLGLPSRQEIKVGTGALEMWARAMHRDDIGPTFDYITKADKSLKTHVDWYHDHTGEPDPLDQKACTEHEAKRAARRAAKEAKKQAEESSVVA